MATRTVYVKDSDIPMWDRAQAELGNVSKIVHDAIKTALDEQSAPVNSTIGSEFIECEFGF